MIKPHHILLLLTAILALSPLHASAQESCYEQYLREHNKTILTADDADDSYDELKKEVIARRILREEAARTNSVARANIRPHTVPQSVVLVIDTITGSGHLLTEDGTVLADARVVMMDSTWYMWLSVDPLADQNPSVSPYIYCNGNPIRFIDPDGRDIVIVGDDGVNTTFNFDIKGQLKDEFTNSVVSDLIKLGDDDLIVRDRINDLVKSSNTHYIKNTKGWNKTITDSELNQKQIPQGSTIEYSPTNTQTYSGESRTPRIGLTHEIQHAWDADKGKLNNAIMAQPFVPLTEVDAINLENRIRLRLNEPIRTQYKGITIFDIWLQ